VLFVLRHNRQIRVVAFRGFDGQLGALERFRARLRELYSYRLKVQQHVRSPQSREDAK
jgi:hypothetical protein